MSEPQDAVPALDTAVSDLMAVALRLQMLADEMMAEAASRESLRSTRRLPDSVSGLQQTLIALAGASSVHPSDGRTEGSLHVLRGAARLVAGNDSIELQTHDYAPLPIGPHVISADVAAVILHSVVAPPEAPPTSRASAGINPSRPHLEERNQRSSGAQR
jgi:hypothetical protein